MQKDPLSQQSDEPPIKNLDEPIVINEEGSVKIGLPGRLKHFRSQVWAKWSKRQKIIATGGTAITLAILVVGAFMLAQPKHLIPRAPESSKSKPMTVASPLSGVQVDPALAKRPVTGIMIENSLDARPQSGLQDAGVVYEAIAEGGITRFLALFQENRPQYIGPVRSLRPYYIDWATPFDASIAHVGGSPDALAQIRSGSNNRDLDEFFNPGSYWREASRPAPHNVYTSFDLLDNLNESKGFITSKVQSFPRTTKDHPLKVPAITSIDMAIAGADFNVHYDYDKATNSYARSEAGAPHIVTLSASDSAGVQLKPKVVIALVVPLGQGALDASGAYYSDYNPNGIGQMFLFEDGGLTAGTWAKTNRGSQITFTDNYGHPVKLNPGQTWITVLSDPSQISYR